MANWGPPLEISPWRRRGLAGKRCRIDGLPLRNIFDEVINLPGQWTQIVNQRQPDGVAPCGAPGGEINLIRSYVRDTGDSVAGVKRFPVRYPS